MPQRCGIAPGQQSRLRAVRHAGSRRGLRTLTLRRWSEGGAAPLCGWRARGGTAFLASHLCSLAPACCIPPLTVGLAPQAQHLPVVPQVAPEQPHQVRVAVRRHHLSCAGCALAPALTRSVQATGHSRRALPATRRAQRDARQWRSAQHAPVAHTAGLRSLRSYSRERQPQPPRWTRARGPRPAPHTSCCRACASRRTLLALARHWS